MASDKLPSELHELPENFSLLEWANNGRNFMQTTGDVVHVIDSLTGKIVGILSQKALTSTTPPPLEVIHTADGSPLVVQKNRNEGPIERGVEFSPLVVHLICQRVAEGESLTKICKDPSMPKYTTLASWRRAHPWIDEMLLKAREDRAEHYRDLALDEALSATDKNDAPAQALKVETYKWLAGVDNTRYSPKAKMDVSVTTPTVIQVITGIERGDDGPKDVQSVHKQSLDTKKSK